MHELSIAEAIIEQVTDRFGDTPVAAVRVEVGVLAGVVPSALTFCFELAAEGTPVRGARLDIDVIEAVCACRRCGERFQPKDQVLLCKCGSADVAVLGGGELRIRSVEVAAHV